MRYVTGSGTPFRRPAAFLSIGKTAETPWALGLVFQDDGSIVNGTVPVGKTAHERSRDRHEPGSGNYLNRYAFPPESKCSISVSSWHSTRYHYSVNEEYDGRLYAPESPHVRLYSNYWDGSTCAYCSYQRQDTPHWLLQGTVYYTKISEVQSYPGESRVTVRYSWKSCEGLYYYPIADYSESDMEDEVRHFMESTHWGDFDNPPFVYHDRGVHYTGSEYLWAYPESGWSLSVSDGKLSPRMDWMAERMEFMPHNHWGTLEAEAYVRAVDSLPHLGMNNIANIVEIITSISRILLGEVSGAGDLSSLWLGYRYGIDTTKADAKELARMLNRLAGLAICKHIRARSMVRDGDTVVKCSITLNSEQLDKVFSVAQKWGTEFNSYNAWDLIPYSFVVDWFLGVGDILEHAESIKVAYKSRRPAWFSIEREYINEFGCRELDYYRHYAVPNLNEAYLYRAVHDASGVTIVKRVIDALALVR